MWNKIQLSIMQLISDYLQDRAQIRLVTAPQIQMVTRSKRIRFSLDEKTGRIRGKLAFSKSSHLA